ncbi:MAG TPA: diguanylate cyclase [Blastocatellia bacterium]|nr:diguanylate cyclase [Blastocatellia bacterium]
MKPLFEELRGLAARARVICVFVIAMALLMLTVSVVRVIGGPAESLFMLLAFAAIIAFFTGSRPVILPGAKTVVSVSESIIFLGAILLGPFHAAVLGLIDAVAGSRKLAKKQVYVAINMSVLSLSAFASACVYQFAYSQLERNSLLGYEQQTLELLVLPILALATSHYIVNIGLMALLSNVWGTGGFFRLWRETFPWIPTTYLAGAAAAGITGYTLSRYTIEAALLVMVLALPIPLIIYYTFKTYHAKLDDERRHLEQMNEVHRSTLEALAMAIDAKDQTTHKHIRRVQVYASRLGELVKMSERELKALEAASLLHDIGKLGVPDYILNKPGKLTAAEFEKMKIHPVVGAEILSNVKFGFPVATYVRAHHERWDGCGYPDGLKGEEIPLGARILALVDHFDALHSDRPYRKAMTREEAILHISQLSGSFFDPSLVSLFLENLKNFDREIASMAIPDQEPAPKARAVAANTSAPAAGYAEEQRPLTEVALDRIAAAHQEVMTLHDIARVLSSTLSLQDTVAIIAGRINNLVPYSTCVIYLVEEGKEELRVEHASGLHMDLFRGRTFRIGEGITGWVVANHRPMYNTSPMLDLSFLGAEAAERYKGVVVFPAMKDGAAIGAVALYSVDHARYTDEHLRLLEMIMQPVSDALHNALLFENARQTALTDSLTGLPNMRAFGILFDREVTLAARSQHPVSILVVDLDEFKQINDTFGHIVGDRVLLNIGQVLRRQLRENDMVARYAGDEFVILLPMTDQEQAGYVVSRIQNAVSQYAYTTGEGERASVTASVGAATIPADGQSFEELMMLADKRMYRSKDDTRSRPRSDGAVVMITRRNARAL